MGTEADPVRAPTLRLMVPSMFLPAIVYEIGNGAVAPVIAITALDLGASAGTAGLDRHGRLAAVAVPSMLVLGTAMAALPLTGGLVALTGVAMVMSFGNGNGIGAGIVMTLGADVAPPQNRRRFLSKRRLTSDSGNALGPVVMSLIAGAWALAAGIVAVGGVGLLAAGGLAIWAPRYSPFATRAMVRAHRGDDRRLGDMRCAGAP